MTFQNAFCWVSFGGRCAWKIIIASGLKVIEIILIILDLGVGECA